MTSTREYTSKAERRGARKVTRHPLYQKMRERALAAEITVFEQSNELKTLRDALKKAKRRADSTDPAATATGG